MLLAGCASKEVVVTGDFPTPLVQKSPLKIGVIYRPEFSSHEIFETGKTSRESDWRVKTGNAQVEFWTTFLSGMFSKVVVISDAQELSEKGSELAAVLIPTILALEYMTPRQTNEKVYELWMKYRFVLAEPHRISEDEDGNLFADPVDHIASWTLSAYGKTPTARLQSDEEAVNLAAVMALRDVGASFATYLINNPRDRCSIWAVCDSVWQDLLRNSSSSEDPDAT